jgi:hypothetical protein
MIQQYKCGDTVVVVVARLCFANPVSSIAPDLNKVDMSIGNGEVSFTVSVDMRVLMHVQLHA